VSITFVDLRVLAFQRFKCSRAAVLNRGGVKQFSGGREPLHALQHRKF